MKMFSRQNVFFVWQDLVLQRAVLKIILGVMALLMVAGIFPLGMVMVGKWHSLKDFILLYRYEFFHLPAFLLLLGSALQTNAWVVLRRYRTRRQIGLHKALLVIVLAGGVSLWVAAVGGLCTTFAKYIIYPNIQNVHAAFLYVPHSGDKSSFPYFLVMYFFITVIYGLLFIAFIDFGWNRFFAFVAVIILAILDMFTVHILPYLFYISERTAPVWTILLLIMMMVVLVYIICLSSSQKNYYVQDDLL
ncbi:hypothetical protein [Geobacillus sp. TFV-3]|uniref:hypothetical protein n=1 Tax=Geobacillus sp. TFV-3 TaxID=1897059 RepID=UPI0013587E13|nr:hypothetical protein [Geobacillus sp. TFV-3]KAF0993771.1 hypothetical protein BJQ97_00396 [Geobacillus sp. TFV-3]